MRDTYQDSPGQARDVSVRRLGRLTWRATQLGTLATVGFAVVFARSAPAQTAPVQNPPTAAPAASATPQHTVTRKPVTSSPTRKPAAVQPSAPAAQPAAPTTAPTAPKLAPAHHAPGPGADDRRSRPDDEQRVARRGLMPPTCYGEHTSKALGTFATLLVADPAALADARGLLDAELAAIDAACSRFRPDSELRRACAAGGRPVPVSPLFAEALSVALAAARLTDGDVDPTCGQALANLGYDQDFGSARRDTGVLTHPPVPGGRVARDRTRRRPGGGDGP